MLKKNVRYFKMSPRSPARPKAGTPLKNKNDAKNC